ncbi:MAG: hypothetical protein A2Y73_00050 [Chloroflexi bacterium RBG_13_56_8]|nr:MAG: hypothetical protein A2Y73_00050 [Chloroflexi bacterium RBG_13_56_8]
MPFKARVYIFALLVVAVFLAVVAVFRQSFTPNLLLLTGLFTVGVCVADLYPVGLPFEGHGEFTVSCAVKTAAVILFGPWVAILVTFIGTLAAETILRKTWYKTIFNAAQMTITFAGVGFVYELLHVGARAPFSSLQNLGAVVCIVLTYFLVNTALVMGIIVLTTGATFQNVWTVNIRDLGWNDVTVISLGAVMAALWDYSPWSVLTLAIPLVILRQASRYVADLQRQTREALVRMADAIDRRDPSTYQHSQRVAMIAEEIAKEMGVLSEDVKTIQIAGRLHDVGKIGMSNALLYKPGSFDDAELGEFRQHPVIGSDLVRGFRLFNEGPNLIRYHHERYDGRGYPEGIAAEEIPLGSRILAVADSLDAMVSRRVYKGSLSFEEAMEEVRKNRGKQFDPEVVDALERVVERADGRLPWPSGKAILSEIV